MGETSSRIEQHIAEERHHLEQDLRLIEEKIHQKAASLQRNTAVLAGLSMLAGVFLFLLVSRWTRA